MKPDEIEWLKREIKNRICIVFGCISALIPLEVFVWYLFNEMGGLLENKIPFILFCFVISGIINIVYFYVIIEPLTKYREECAYIRRCKENDAIYKKWEEDKMKKERGILEGIK